MSRKQQLEEEWAELQAKAEVCGLWIWEMMRLNKISRELLIEKRKEELLK